MSGRGLRVGPYASAMRTITAGIAVAAVLLLSSCSSDDAADDTTTTTTAAVTTTSETPSSLDTVPPASDDEPTSTEAGTIAIATSSVGPVLVDGSGKALYVFDLDTDGVPTCTDEECASKWPAVVADEIEVAEGVDASAFSLVARDDGTSQLAVDGMPLYTMAADLTDGEPGCQGGEDVWWAVNPDGTANRTLP